MSSEKVKAQIFIIGMSSVLKLHHQTCKLPAPLPSLVKAGVEAYWENGSFAGFSKIMSKRIVNEAIKATPLLREIPDRLYDEKRQVKFIEALYQEIFSFFELCFMDNYRYLALVSYSVESIAVVFTQGPHEVTRTEAGSYVNYQLTPDKIKEDEK